MKKSIPKFPKNPTFNSSDLLQPINMFTSPLVSHLKSDWKIFGTGVIIAPGFAITAKHVITALIERYERIQIDKPNNSIPQDIKGTHNTFLFQLLDKKYFRWTVNQCFLSPYTVVCFLSLSPLFNVKNYKINQKINLALRQP